MIAQNWEMIEIIGGGLLWLKADRKLKYSKVCSKYKQEKKEKKKIKKGK